MTKASGVAAHCNGWDRLWCLVHWGAAINGEPPATVSTQMEDPKLVARNMTLQDASWLEDLWLQYWANGGDADRFDFDV